ncbi:MAG: hypothetical protein ACYDCH_05720 [Gaiellaceae bacterium]
MAASAPRLTRQLLRRLEKTARTTATCAEITRSVGEYAETIGQARPSYEQVRVLVRRTRREASRPSVGEVALEVALRARDPRDLVDAVVFGEVRPLR